MHGGGAMHDGLMHAKPPPCDRAWTTGEWRLRHAVETDRQGSNKSLASVIVALAWECSISFLVLAGSCRTLVVLILRLLAIVVAIASEFKCVFC